MLTTLNLLAIPSAIILDRFLGELPNKYHPLALFGIFAYKLEHNYRLLLQKFALQNKYHLYFAGFVASLSSLLPFFILLCLANLILEQIDNGILYQVLNFLFLSICLYFCIGMTSLMEHAKNITVPLEKNDLPTARKALSYIVGRNTSEMDEAAISRACIESISENLTDSVISSLFWFSLGLYFSPEMAIYLVILHRAFNTLDAMWGKRNEDYQYFGTFAARLDDVLNYIPARLSLFTIVIAAKFTAKTDYKEALKIGLKYRNHHSSPNSAWSEATFAGALNLKLGGPVTYKNLFVDYPYFGEGTTLVNSKHVEIAIKLMQNSVIVFSLACCTALAFCLF